MTKGLDRKNIYEKEIKPVIIKNYLLYISFITKIL